MWRFLKETEKEILQPYPLYLIVLVPEYLSSGDILADAISEGGIPSPHTCPQGQDRRLQVETDIVGIGGFSGLSVVSVMLGRKVCWGIEVVWLGNDGCSGTKTEEGLLVSKVTQSHH